MVDRSEMKKNNKRRVLYVVEDTRSAQFRYRVKNVIEAVSSSNDWQVSYVLKTELDEVKPDGFNLVVILRQTDKDGRIGQFIKKVHEVGINVLFDLDDLIFDYRDLPVLMRTTNSKNVAYWAGYFWGIRRIAKKVDGFICTNGFLAGKLERSFGKPVMVIRNSLNKEQVEVSEKMAKGKEVRRKERDGFVVGYFSGSPTHKKDFELVEPSLINLMKAHDDAKLMVVGYMEFSKEMQRMVEAGRVDIIGMMDYLELQKLISEVNVNIAPLVINDFTNCKSELKFFEAAVVETTTIASPAYAFSRAIEDGINGFLAQPGEWYDKLEYLYGHSEKCQKIAERARKDALMHYYGKEFLDEVEEGYDRMVNGG